MNSQQSEDTQGSKSHSESRPGTPFTVSIDNEEYDVSEHELTGSQILAIVGVTPETHRLIQIKGRNQDPIGPNDIVRISSGLRFVTVSNEPTPVA